MNLLYSLLGSPNHDIETQSLPSQPQILNQNQNTIIQTFIHSPSVDEKSIPKSPILQFLVCSDYNNLKKFCHNIGLMDDVIIHIAMSIKQQLKSNSAMSINIHDKVYLYFRSVIHEMMADDPNKIIQLSSLRLNEQVIQEWQPQMDKKECQAMIVIEILCRLVTRYTLNSCQIIQYFPSDQWFLFKYATEYDVSYSGSQSLQPLWMFKCSDMVSLNPYEISWPIPIKEREQDKDQDKDSTIMYVSDCLSNLPLYLKQKLTEIFMKPFIYSTEQFDKAKDRLKELYRKKPVKNEDDKYMIIMRYVIPLKIHENQHITMEFLHSHLYFLAGIILYIMP